MLAERLTKIRALIQTSNILSPQERTEWLGLLELMNDKQLLELERILAKTPPPKTTVPTNVPLASLSSQPAMSSRPAPVLSTPPKLAADNSYPAPGWGQMPKLSHIVNLPKNLEASAAAKTLPVKPQSQPLKGPMADKLKALLGEKDLPAAPAEALLPSPPVKVEPVKPQAASIFPPLQAKPAAPAKPPVVPLPKFPAQAVPAPITSKPLDKSTFGQVSALPKQPSPAKTEPVLKINGDLEHKPVYNQAQSQPQPKTPAAVTLSANEEVRKLLKKALSVESKKIDTAPHAGLSFPKVSMEERQDSLKSIGQIKSVDHPISESVSPAHSLAKLEDLSYLEADDLQPKNYNKLLSFLRSLIGQHGYHDVIFSIEKSPLYQTYLKTGSTLLSTGQDFEQLAGQAGILSRRQFEQLVDLLRQMQTG